VVHGRPKFGRPERDIPAPIVTTSATASDSPTLSPDARNGTITSEPASTPHLTTWVIAACLIVYVVLRIALIPSAADVTKSFSHDSAYIAIVARNLLAGRGLVNDASWLVFLDPPALPMPFHNANPLYILATAGIAAVTGGNVVRAGLIVSAVSSALLVLAVMWLVSYFTTRRVALIVAVMAASFPPIYQLSLSMLPDALCLALSVAFMAAFVRVETRWTWIAAGALFGLAWLTRSSSTLMLPAAFVYGALSWGWRRTLIRCAGVGVATLVVVSPWLWHSYLVWGKPLHSDASYYLIQDVVALKLGGAPDDALLRYWHSTTVPPSTGAVLKADPVWFIKWVLVGLPKVVVAMGTEWASSSARGGDRARRPLGSGNTIAARGSGGAPSGSRVLSSWRRRSVCSRFVRCRWRYAISRSFPFWRPSYSR
jgi:4-amino-4-deoxy-L-arabinose transferase-like glycosyltransferase